MQRVYLWRSLANIDLARVIGATHMVEFVSDLKEIGLLSFLQQFQYKGFGIIIGIDNDLFLTDLVKRDYSYLIGRFDSVIDGFYISGEHPHYDEFETFVIERNKNVYTDIKGLAISRQPEFLKVFIRKKLLEKIKITITQNFKKPNEIIWHYELCSCGNDKPDDAIAKFRESGIVSIGYVFDPNCRSKFTADEIINKWLKIKIR